MYLQQCSNGSWSALPINTYTINSAFIPKKQGYGVSCSDFSAKNVKLLITNNTPKIFPGYRWVNNSPTVSSRSKTIISSNEYGYRWAYKSGKTTKYFQGTDGQTYKILSDVSGNIIYGSTTTSVFPSSSSIVELDAPNCPHGTSTTPVFTLSKGTDLRVVLYNESGTPNYTILEKSTSTNLILRVTCADNTEVLVPVITGDMNINQIIDVSVNLPSGAKHIEWYPPGTYDTPITDYPKCVINNINGWVTYDLDAETGSELYNYLNGSWT